jgi:proteasome lid subunit RPN8/RPN11
MKPGADDLIVSPSVVDAIVAHARAEAPNECCGLLTGRGNRVASAIPTRNALASPTRFLVDPRDHFAALRRARSRAEAVIGAYHSHVASAAEPSKTDLEEATDSSLVHVIVSLAGAEPAVRAFRLVGGRFCPVALRILDEIGKSTNAERLSSRTSVP